MNKTGLLAIIPARGGSKGLPRKNVLPLGGIPLIAYTIKAALDSEYVTDVFVTTEDKEIADISLQYGAQVIDRPGHLSGDEALSSDVVIHAIRTLQQRGLNSDYFVLLQPTSPLRNASHISQCAKTFFTAGKYLSAMSVTECESHPLKNLLITNNELVPVGALEQLEMPRQKLPPAVRQNGAIYIAKTDTFLNACSFFIPPVMPFPMEAEVSIDIDILSDLQKAEQFFSKNESNY